MASSYHVTKVTRVYEGKPYCGFSSNYEPAEYTTLEEARAAAAKMLMKNPVGWVIYDAKTHKMVEEIVSDE